MNMKFVIACLLAAAFVFKGAPVRAAEFTDDAFCAASEQAAKEMQANGPQWADQVTRNDGMTVDCSSKTLEYKKYLKLKAADLQHGWEDQMQQAWDQTYCGDANVAAAIAHGWTIDVNITMADDATLPITVSCGQ